MASLGARAAADEAVEIRLRQGELRGDLGERRRVLHDLGALLRAKPSWLRTPVNNFE